MANGIDKENSYNEGNFLNFRKYKEGDESGIIELMKPYWKHFDSEKAYDFWEWEYKNNPNGQALMLLAEHDGKIVGHYAILPIRMSYDHITINGGKAEGSVVHPEYRGNIAPRFYKKEKDVRIFEKLIHNLFETAEKRQVDLIWGFPNTIALKPQIRTGYHYIPMPITIMILPIDINKAFDKLFSAIKFKTLFILGSKLYYKVMTTSIIHKNLRTDKFWEKFRAENKVLIRELSVSDLDEKIDKFWEKFSIENKCITVERNQKYLGWRFIQDPVIPHKVFVCERNEDITATVVINMLHQGNVTANIVDIVGLENYETDLHFLLLHVIQILRDEGVTVVETWFGENEQSRKYVRILKKCKFLSIPIKKRLHLIVKILNQNLKKDVIYNMDNWYITMAFTEGV